MRSDVTEPAGRRWQISVAQILVLTGQIAVLAAIALRVGRPQLDWYMVWLDTRIFLRFALPVPLFAWAILSSKRVAPRFTIAAIVAAMVIMFWPLVWSNSRWMWKFTAAYLAILALSLVVVRIAGYRFARPMPKEATSGE